jgi:tetratricopeptide (TPR) repeat protein
MIPRPIFYGACAVILTLIVGVMYVMRPQPAEDYGPQADQTQTGPESNAQIIARELQDGKTKLEAGDTTGAIEAFTRALLVDPNHPEALDLKMKAEEKRHQDSLAANKTPAQATTTPAAATATPGGEPPPAATTTAATTTPASTTSPTTSPATATASTATTAATQKPGGPGARDLAAQKRKEKASAAIAAKAYAQGKSALSSGRYREAIGAFESALLNSPNYQDATMQYTRAAELLPADDANGRAARERLENLKRQP